MNNEIGTNNSDGNEEITTSKYDFNIYKANVWFMINGGYMTDTSLFIQNKWACTACNLWCRFVSIVCDGVFVWNIFRLFVHYRYPDFPAKCMDVALYVTIFAVKYLLRCKMPLLLSVIKDFENCASITESKRMKTISTVCFGAFAFNSISWSILTVFQIFTSDYYLQDLYDNFFHILTIDVTVSPLILRLFALLALSYTFVAFPCALVAAFAMGITMHAHLRYRYEALMTHSDYESTSGLREIKRRISEVDLLMRKLNEWYSAPALCFLLSGCFIYCLSVVNFCTDKPMPPGYNFNSTAALMLSYVIWGVAGSVFTLLADDKTIYKTTKVYAVSARKDPSDIDYAIQAEMLAKQMDQMEIFVTIWVFSKVKRRFLIDVTSGFLTYFTVIVQNNAIAMDFLIHNDAKDD